MHCVLLRAMYDSDSQPLNYLSAHLTATLPRFRIMGYLKQKIIIIVVIIISLFKLGVPYR